MVFVIEALIVFAILIYSVILHEVVHGFVAEKLGDPTARLAGRLTFDPRPHIDPWMTIVLPLLLFLSNIGIIFGSAKPVPVDPFNFREPKKDMALVALSGPVTNLLIAVFLTVLYHLTSFIVLNDTILRSVHTIFFEGASLNITLALFNIFPLPPLDGFKVLAGILPDSLASELYKLERFGFMIIFLVLFLLPNVIFSVIGPIKTLLLNLLFK